MNIKPLNDKVVIKRAEAETVTAGGIVLPENAREEMKQGTVLAVGPGKLLENGSRAPMSVKKGDKVMLSPRAGYRVSDDLDKLGLMIIPEDEILGVI